jgi:glycosyltransferase involved in cell wall biosynthesis
MSPPVSVIVTCYNLERYIGDTIRSVLAQDYGGPIEIIVADDCSTDSSADIIRGFAEVEYVRTAQNGGVLQAMIAGIKAARNDLLLFLDGDDLWEPAKIRRVAEAFEHNPRLAFVTHDILCIDGAGRELAIPSRPARKMPLIPADQVSDRLRQAALEMDDFICLGSAVSVSRSRGNIDGFIRFAETLPDPVNTYQDWPLACWCAVQPGAEFAYVPAVLYRYRLHGANHSGDARTRELAGRNLTRTRNTLDAMLAIAGQAKADPRTIKSLKQRKTVIVYLIDLTAGRRLEALRGFVKSIPDLRRRKLLLKEVARLVGIQLLGPKRFLQLAGQRSILRHIRAT